MFAPIWRNKKLVWIQALPHLHPRIILGIHAAQTFNVAKSWRQVLAKMTVIREILLLVEIIKVRAEEISWISTLGETTSGCVVLEECYVEPEFISAERRRKPEWTFLQNRLVINRTRLRISIHQPLRSRIP